MIKRYTVMLFDKNDKTVLKHHGIRAHTRSEAMWDVAGRNKSIEWKTWDAREERDIQPRLFPEEEADDCRVWTRLNNLVIRWIFICLQDSEWVSND